MSYDLFATTLCQSQTDVDGIVAGQINGQTIPDIYARIQLLAPALLREQRWNRIKGKDYGSATVNRGHAATAGAGCCARVGGRPRRLGATQAGSGT